MNERVDIDQEFAIFSPCIYKGKIKCNNCDRYKYCDMKEGRENRRETFKNGWKGAINFMIEEYVNQYSSL